MASQCRCKASQRVKIQASRWNGHGMLGSRLRFPWGMRQGYSCWDAWFFWRFFWCSSCINRTRALSGAAFADSLLHLAIARPFSINLDRQIPIFGVDSASTEGLAQYRSIFSQGSWMPQIQPWIDERKWKRRRWWLWGHRHGRLPHRKSFFWLRLWLSDFPWAGACC